MLNYIIHTIEHGCEFLVWVIEALTAVVIVTLTILCFLYCLIELLFDLNRMFRRRYAERVINYYTKHPNRLTKARIRQETDGELAAKLFAIKGFAQYCDKRTELTEDECGTLYYFYYHLGLELVMVVKVKNSTPEPDGSFKHYYIQVDPIVNSAREAVAWSFGLDEYDYQPVVES